MTRQQSNHFVSRPILVAGFGRLLPRLPVGRLETFGLALRFGAVTALLWEFADYLTFVRTNEDELRTAYGTRSVTSRSDSPVRSLRRS